MPEQVRTRFAPSPTGYLHIGGLRTALYNYLYAKKHNGRFLLRIEDTDQSRYVREAEQDIIDALHWSGLDYDEGPDKDQGHGPYYQSERKSIYQQYARQLLDGGYAYYAFDSSDEIDQMRERLSKSGNPSPKYDAVTRQSMRNSLTLPREETERLLEEDAEHIIRLKVPRRETIRHEDHIRGVVSFESDGLDDQVLIKSDGMPTYHMANVVDDHLMGISHVVRGEEWLSSLPKHILLYRYLGWQVPEMAHLPLIMSPEGGKLSKRSVEKQGIPANVRDYIDQDFEPEALVNFLAFLGWNPGDEREVFHLDELIREFSLERVGKGGAVFNYNKLIWFNEQFMREKPENELVERVRPYLEQASVQPGDEYLQQVIALLKDRVSRVPEFYELGYYFFRAPESYDEKTRKKAWKQQTPELVKAYRDTIAELEDDRFEASTLKQTLNDITEQHGVGFGKLMLPVRLAVTGMGFGPDLFETQQLLGRQEVLERLDHALLELA